MHYGESLIRESIHGFVDVLYTVSCMEQPVLTPISYHIPQIEMRLIYFTSNQTNGTVASSSSQEVNQTHLQVLGCQAPPGSLSWYE